DTRYLTGADFDIESIKPVADGFWLGDEFGPFLKFDTSGRLTDVIPTTLDGKPVLSPDNPLLSVPANPAAKMPVFNLKRSGGFEGLAISKDGAKVHG
ncbi:esterase-like activity of phytase family protein, partial [Rhizobium ruizarguesonis]